MHCPRAVPLSHSFQNGGGASAAAAPSGTAAIAARTTAQSKIPLSALPRIFSPAVSDEAIPAHSSPVRARLGSSGETISERLVTCQETPRIVMPVPESSPGPGTELGCACAQPPLWRFDVSQSLIQTSILLPLLSLPVTVTLLLKVPSWPVLVPPPATQVPDFFHVIPVIFAVTVTSSFLVTGWTPFW